MGTPPTPYQTECMTGLWKKIQNSSSKGNLLSSHISGSVNNVKFLIITKMSENIKKIPKLSSSASAPKETAESS